MKKVQIFLSSYNGEKCICRQIDSILAQKDVEIYLTIRDDGSTDKTVEILKTYSQAHKGQIKIIQGENMGWARSFIELLKYAENYDYFGFSDQDDYWFPQKVKRSIEVMEADSSFSGAKLVQTNQIYTDSELSVLRKQEIRPVLPKNKKEVIAQEYFKGCSMLWNKNAMDLLNVHYPEQAIPHDYWVGLICTWFGRIYYEQTSQFYHIRYGTNSSTDGNQMKGRLKRIKRFLSGENAYINPADDLLKGYGYLMSSREKVFLKRIKSYKNKTIDKMMLLFDLHFRRESLFSSVLFKLSILMNRY